MERFQIAQYKTYRLIAGGVLLLAASMLVMWISEFWATILLICAFISSLRAIWNGAPISGFFLTKLNGGLLIALPFFFMLGGIDRLKRESREIHFPPVRKQTYIDTVIPVREEVQRAQPAKINKEAFKEPALQMSAEAKLVPIPKKSEVVSRPESVEDFIRRYRVAEQTDNLEFVLQQYAPEVRYFGKELSRAQIRDDKAKYWATWPVRSETFQGAIKVTKDLHPEWERDFYLVEFRTSFRNEQPDTGKWFEGEIDNLYIVLPEKGTYQVKTQEVTVVATRKGGGKIQPKIVMNTPDLEVTDSAREAVEIIEKLRHAEQGRDLQSISELYAKNVRYFDKNLSLEVVLRDKEKYFKRWPKLESKRLSPYTVEIIARRNFLITYQSEFRVSSYDGHKVRSGVIDNRYLVTMTTSPMKIVEQSGKVSKLRQNKFPK